MALLLPAIAVSDATATTTGPAPLLRTGPDSVAQIDGSPLAGGGDDIFFGDGYALASSGIGIRSSYVLRPVSTHLRSAELVPLLADLAAELTAATGATFTVGTSIPASTTTAGTISVELSTTSGCGPLSKSAIGCGGFAAQDGVVSFGWAWLHPSVLDDARLARAALGHEVGHALGLAHFEDQFQGETQLMHTTLADATLRRYRNGDIRGLQRAATNGFLLGVPAGPLPPLAPTALDVSSGSGVLRGTWSVVDQGSDLLGHEVEVAPAAGASTVQPFGATRSAAIDGLVVGDSYRMRVRAENAAGFGPWSTWSTLVMIIETCSGPFVDVGESHPFCAQIAWVADEAIATGFPDGTYRPGAAVSRQAMAAFLRRLAARGEPDPTAGPWPDGGFLDVTATNPFDEDIDWLVAAAITEGYSDGGFHPTAPVTRQAMAAFLRRLAAALWGPEAVAIEPGAEAFSDVPIGHPFHDDVAWMRDRGLSNGTLDDDCGCTLYHPGDAISRQAMAAFLLGLDALEPPAT